MAGTKHKSRSAGQCAALPPGPVRRFAALSKPLPAECCSSYNLPTELSRDQTWGLRLGPIWAAKQMWTDHNPAQNRRGRRRELRQSGKPYEGKHSAGEGFDKGAKRHTGPAGQHSDQLTVTCVLYPSPQTVSPEILAAGHITPESFLGWDSGRACLELARRFPSPALPRPSCP